MRAKFYVPVFITIFFLYGDRGLIPLNTNATVFEPNQRAMIAWNGREEILLLTTDLNATDSTVVLEILPLPSEPKVKKGNIETFQRAVQLINQKTAFKIAYNGKRNGSKIKPPFEITFHEKIGPHDISVAHLNESQGFVEWVKDYLSSLGFAANIISDQHKNLIEDYIKSGFTYFVFDLVHLNEETKTNEPIQYRFKTRRLFYPLKITSLSSGETKIELLILTPQLLKNFPGISAKEIKLPSEPITITNEELKTLDEDMYELLKENEEMKLRIWKIEGILSSFDKDLIAY